MELNNSKVTMHRAIGHSAELLYVALALCSFVSASDYGSSIQSHVQRCPRMHVCTVALSLSLGGFLLTSGKTRGASLSFS